MVSNYELGNLHKIFAISDSEYLSRKIQTDEQFSPIVIIVDAETQQPLDCVLLLHGEKPPEVSCRTLSCYIAAKVTAVKDCDTHSSYPHPLYHMKSKPCKPGKLPLSFSFHQPGTVCVIQLSIHTIVDSDGVEYMHHSEDCTCIVQIIDRDQKEVLRMKEPTFLRFTGPLATKQYLKQAWQFKELYLSGRHQQIQQLSKQLLFQSGISVDIKVFSLCWQALSEAVYSQYESAEEILKIALSRASKLNCENSVLLQGRVLRHLAYLHHRKKNDVKAWDYISQAKDILSNAAPSYETAHALHTELLVESHALTFSSDLYTSTDHEKKYERLLEHATYMKEDYEKPAICNFFVMKASFHLRSKMITDKLPPKEYWPTPDDLEKAEDCLSKTPPDTMQGIYTARYYFAHCDLYIWKQQYYKAMHYLEEARKIIHEMKSKRNAELRRVDQRLKLLKRLKGEIFSFFLFVGFLFLLLFFVFLFWLFFGF